MLNCFKGIWRPIGGRLRRSQKVDSEESEEGEVTRHVVQRSTPPGAATTDASHQLTAPTPLVPKIKVRTVTEVLPGQHAAVDDFRSHTPSAHSPATMQPSRRSSLSSSASQRSRSDSKSFTKSGHALRELLNNARFESPQRAHDFVIPKSEQEAIITIPAIAKDIKARNEKIDEAEASEHAERACSCARQLYATLAYIKKGAEICPLLREGITDADLPLVRKKEGNRRFALYKKDGGPVKAMQEWDEKYSENFDRFQWWMTSPVFEDQEHYELDKKAILPFVPLKESEESLETKQGGYSEVFPVRIHPAHHNFWQNCGCVDDEPLVAVKRLFSSDGTEFRKEASILKALGRKNHDHLIKLLATYKQGEKYHLMFPYADANLRVYWERKMPTFDKETVLWSLKQMRGIANGLCLIHNFRVTFPLSVSGAGNVRMPKDNVRLSVQGGEERYGRHGDLKPENLLWFAQAGDPENPFGVLKIADFGLGRFHGRDSRSQVNPSAVQASPTYEPPECKLHKPVSRAYDMWSLGCVYLEFITWLLKGSAEIDCFANRRGKVDSLGIDNDSFCLIIHGMDGDNAILKEGVVSWVHELRAHGSCSAVIHDLLDITMRGLLVIDTKDRMNSSILYQKLDEVLKKAEFDVDYLLKQAPRQMLTNSAPAGLCVPKAHRRSHSLTSSEREKVPQVQMQSKVQVQTALPTTKRRGIRMPIVVTLHLESRDVFKQRGLFSRRRCHRRYEYCRLGGPLASGIAMVARTSYEEENSEYMLMLDVYPDRGV